MKPVILLAYGLLFPTYALGQCSSDASKQLDDALIRANNALSTDDLIEHGAAVRDIKATLPCLNQPLPTTSWSEFLVGLAIVEYTLGRDWTSYLDTAYRINVNLSVQYGPPDIRQYLPKKIISEVRSVHNDATYYLDGLPLNEVGDLVGLHVAQRQDASSWETRVLDNDSFPDHWLQPKPAPLEDAADSANIATATPPQRLPRGSGLLVVGSAITAAGTLGIATSFALSRTVETPTESQVSNLKAVNVSSWGVLVLGAGLGITGVVVSQRSALELRPTPFGIQLHGRLP